MPIHGPSTSDVSLREVTQANVSGLVGLRVAPEQARFVAPNGDTIAEGAFTPAVWMRGIYSGEEPVGFLALFTDEAKSFYCLWRFMIAAGQQRRGLGSAALALLVEHVRILPGARELVTSYVPGDGDPSAFYAKHGFVETDEVEDGERVMKLAL